MAVSKMHPVSAILAAEALGIRLFGENRVQEFQEKSVALEASGTTGAEFHLIGHLQSNKAAARGRALRFDRHARFPLRLPNASTRPRRGWGGGWRC